MQFVRVEVAGSVEPGLGLEVGRVDHQCVAFPAAARIAHVELDAFVVVRPAIGENHAIGVHVLIDDRDAVVVLEDLERLRQ